jgi:hypothetical protein
VAHRIRSLILASRIAYLAAAGLFAAAVVIAVLAAVTTVSTADGGFSITADVPDDSPAVLAVDWIALASFTAAALGALLTVLVRVESPEEEQPEHSH